jgi:ABC-2 type transport system permease protein
LTFALPPSYVLESMRSLFAGGAPSGLGLLWAALLDVLYILLTAWFFTRIFRHARRTSLLARYSAETLS